MGNFVVPGIMSSVNNEIENFLILCFTTYIVAIS